MLSVFEVEEREDVKGSTGTFVCVYVSPPCLREMVEKGRNYGPDVEK